MDQKPQLCCNLELEYKEIGNDDYKATRAICSNCDSVYEIKDKVGLVYFQKNGHGNFKHLECGETIMVVEVIHSLLDNNLAGSGSTARNPVPYCPKHEEKPDWQGVPNISST